MYFLFLNLQAIQKKYPLSPSHAILLKDDTQYLYHVFICLHVMKIYIIPPTLAIKNIHNCVLVNLHFPLNYHKKKSCFGNNYTLPFFWNGKNPQYDHDWIEYGKSNCVLWKVFAHISRFIWKQTYCSLNFKWIFEYYSVLFNILIFAWHQECFALQAEMDAQSSGWNGAGTRPFPLQVSPYPGFLWTI